MPHFTHVVIGGGPAGLQMSYFLQKRGVSHVVLERHESVGAFFQTYPRHRKLISINKIYVGYTDRESRLRYDWNSLLSDDERLLFRHYSHDYFPDARHLVRYLEDFAKAWRLPVECNAVVTNVARSGAGFVVTTATGQRYGCDHLIVATGLSSPVVPAIDGVELCERYANCSVDPADFRDQTVIIVGKGNSAFETADRINDVARKIQICGPKRLRLAWKSHYVGDIRAVNNNFLDTYHLKGQNNILDGELRRVRLAPNGQRVAEIYFESRQRRYEFTADRIILCTGFRFDGQMFEPDCRPELAHGGKLPALTSEWESVNVPELFFVGTLMQSRDSKKTMSAFIHGFRHNIEAFDQMLEAKDHGRPWRRTVEVPVEPSAVARLVQERVSTAAGLFLQPGFLCDVLVVPEDGRGPARYYEGMPRDYVHDHGYGREPHYYVITLEYGEHAHDHDPFAYPRGIGVSQDFYLHPIVRRYAGDTLVDRFWLSDDLDNDWRRPDSARALEESFTQQLAGAATRAT